MRTKSTNPAKIAYGKSSPGAAIGAGAVVLPRSAMTSDMLQLLLGITRPVVGSERVTARCLARRSWLRITVARPRRVLTGFPHRHTRGGPYTWMASWRRPDSVRY